MTNLLIGSVVFVLLIIAAVGGALPMMDMALATQDELTGAYELFDRLLALTPVILFGTVASVLIMVIVTSFFRG